MRVKFKTVVIVLSAVYGIVTLVIMYKLYSEVIVKFKSSGKFTYRKRHPFS